ncbi:hypothetical protein ILYODFUR_038786 [Ilyodon furcidens]|uniref:Uncharacterized protein n=1 Tax=Ilyodon furcidens TaxID=33524 RepID=A0ABV0UBX4_9TELE
MRRQQLPNGISRRSLRLHRRSKPYFTKPPKDDRRKREKEDYSSERKIPHRYIKNSMALRDCSRGKFAPSRR